MKIFINFFIVCEFATFFYLCIKDWQEVSGFFNLAFCFFINIFLSTIWPIYWAILHWIW